ncbi:MAG: NAD(P)/FAD-dependent oxidoreductase [Candidatus Micrarchaeota archaeon]
MDSFDVVVVGASAVGGVAAREIAGRDLSVALVEEHTKPGKFGKCTAIVSASGLKETGVRFQDSVLNEVKGALIASGNTELELRSPDTKAFVLDRQAFDEQSVEQAVSAGAQLFLNSRLKQVRIVNGLFESKAGKNYFESRFLVGADGAASTVAREFGFPSFKRVVVGWQTEVSGKVPYPDLAEVFLEPEFKGFFGWRVPLSGNRARIGFCVSKKGDFASAKRKLFKLTGASAIGSNEFTHVIPVSVRASTSKNNVFLVGDAAGQVKATTGGGIVFGSRCARVLADCLVSGSDYDTAWRSKYGDGLKFHGLVRKAYDVLPSGGAALALKAFNSFGKGFLLDFADMDDLVKVKR